MDLHAEPSIFTKTAQLYITSASLVTACVPYSLLALEPINKKLEARAKSLSETSLVDATAEHGIRKEETVHYLVDQWATANLVRSFLTGLAAILSTWAAVERLRVGKLRVMSGAERIAIRR